jgi:hypothetical protein
VGNDERASDDERLFADVLDCFVPRNDERASDDERLFAGVLDCFVPRNDERASDSDNFAMMASGGQQSCSSYNPVNYLRCFPLRFRSDSDKKKEDKKKKTK